MIQLYMGDMYLRPSDEELRKTAAAYRLLIKWARDLTPSGSGSSVSLADFEMWKKRQNPAGVIPARSGATRSGGLVGRASVSQKPLPEHVLARFEEQTGSKLPRQLTPASSPTAKASGGGAPTVARKRLSAGAPTVAPRRAVATVANRPSAKAAPVRTLTATPPHAPAGVAQAEQGIAKRVGGALSRNRKALAIGGGLVAGAGALALGARALHRRRAQQAQPLR